MAISARWWPGACAHALLAGDERAHTHYGTVFHSSPLPSPDHLTGQTRRACAAVEAAQSGVFRPRRIERAENRAIPRNTRRAHWHLEASRLVCATRDRYGGNMVDPGQRRRSLVNCQEGVSSPEQRGKWALFALLDARRGGCYTVFVPRAISSVG